MQNFIIENQKLIWFVTVILLTLLIILISVRSLDLIERKWEKAKYYSFVFRTFRRLAKIFFTVIGLGLISYIFVDKTTYQNITDNLGRVIWFGSIVILTVVSSALAQGYFRNKQAQLSPRDQGDVTMYRYLNYLVTAVIYLFGILLFALAIPGMANIATAAGASAGVLALVAGVASQEAISNIVGGLFIAFFKPFRIGDIVKIGSDTMGKVEDINLRHTIITDFQNTRIVIPNGIINKENISNYSMIESKNCAWIEVGISYSADIDLAMKVMREICEDNPLSIDNRTVFEKQNAIPKVDVQVVGLGDFSVNLKAWVWSSSYPIAFKMKNEIYKAVKEGFDKHAIEIPFPQRTITIKERKDIEVSNALNI